MLDPDRACIDRSGVPGGVRIVDHLHERAIAADDVVCRHAFAGRRVLEPADGALDASRSRIVDDDMIDACPVAARLMSRMLDPVDVRLRDGGLHGHFQFVADIAEEALGTRWLGELLNECATPDWTK